MSARSPRRDFALLLLATVTCLSNYAALLSVVPLWAASAGSTATGVGATTTAMMAATAATQLAMGPLLRRLSLRRMLTGGALVMTLATPFYLLSAELVPVLVVSAVRGVGFALLVVAGSALVAEIVPAQRLARGAAAYGLAAGLPQLVALPLGVWVAQRWSFTPVFVAATVLALVAVPLGAALTAGGEKGSGGARPDPGGGGGGAAVTLRPLVAPALVFFTLTMGFGGIVTFLPLAVPDAATAPAALFVASLCMLVGRMAAGMAGDRLTAGRQLLPGALVGAAGMVGIALGTTAGGGAWVAVGAGLFGLGLGIVQNDSLVLILGRAGPGRHGTASAVWNFAYDGGTGAGAVLLGAVVAGADYPWAFAASALVIAVVAPAGRIRRRT
ncbi:MFS transporter [Georgenia sunbinii]|uniref:MFS transporter n=1 Tax=Georgenia sunbinii TaxID=3117728 RepID=UPI002F26451A